MSKRKRNIITFYQDIDQTPGYTSRTIEVSDSEAAEIQAIIDRLEEKSWKEKLGLPWMVYRFSGGDIGVIDANDVIHFDKVKRHSDAEAIVAAMNGLGECFDDRGVFIESDARDWTLADKITNLGRRLKSIVE